MKTTFTKQQDDILALLTGPQPLEVEQIAKGLKAKGYENPNADVVKVQICKIRKLVAKTDFKIKTLPERYHLVRK